MAAFKPENDLEILFVDAATDASKRVAFYRRLLDATLLVAHDGSSAERGSLKAARRQPAFRLLEINGIPHCPAYTSAARAAAQGHGEGYFHQVKARALMESLRGMPFVLNPGSSPSKVFSREEIAALLDGSLPADDA
jgi:hypothetical protein